MNEQSVYATIAPVDAGAMREAKSRWDSVAKPIGSLGLLEDAIVRIAGLTGSADVRLNRRAVVVLCADNGVVRQGVTQTGPEITALVAGNIARGQGTVCRMARAAHADVFAVDMGMLTRTEGALDRRIACGTEDCTLGPAMTRAQAERAIAAGIGLVGELREKGYDLLATGEMGIGNTTTSSALAAVLMDLPVEEATGRGAGLSDAGLLRKTDAIRRAIRINRPDADDPVDVLSKLGGFDIAGMVGVFLGGAIYRVPVLIDGFISAVAALVAARIRPESKCAMLASHVSAEPAARRTLEALALRPLICAEMRLGEGTGAVCALPLLDMALTVYNEMSTFDEIGMQPYQPQGGV